ARLPPSRCSPRRPMMVSPGCGNSSSPTKVSMLMVPHTRTAGAALPSTTLLFASVDAGVFAASVDAVFGFLPGFMPHSLEDAPDNRFLATVLFRHRAAGRIQIQRRLRRPLLRALPSASTSALPSVEGCSPALTRA